MAFLLRFCASSSSWKLALCARSRILSDKPGAPPFRKGSLGEDGIGKKLLDDGDSGLFVLVNEGDARLLRFVEFVEWRREINKLFGFLSNDL